MWSVEILRQTQGTNHGTSAKIFKAIFSCKLYDLNGTNSIQVTNATIRGKILSP